MYIFVFVTGIFLSLFNDIRARKLYLYTIVLAGLAFFRYGVGSDYFAYQYLFERLQPSIIDELKFGIDNQEVLFRIIGSFFKSWGGSYQAYLILFSIINLIFVFKICKNYSNKPVMSMFLYYSFFYFVWTFSGIRQGITLAIGVYYLISCLEENKGKKLILVAILLSSIHLSALVLIVVYFSNRLKLNKRKLIIMSGMSLIVAIMPLNKFIELTLHLPIFNRMSPYLKLEYSLVEIFTFPSIARLGFMLIGFLYYDKYVKRGNVHKIIMDAYLISLNFYFFMKFSELTAARLSIYGFFLSVIVLPNIYSMYKNRFNKLIVISIIVVLSSLYIYKEMKAMENSAGMEHSKLIITPYTNIFNKNKGYYFNNMYK